MTGSSREKLRALVDHVLEALSDLEGFVKQTAASEEDRAGFAQALEEVEVEILGRWRDLDATLEAEQDPAVPPF